MNTQEIAEKLCELEAKKEEVNIAQMNEIVSRIPEMVENMESIEEIATFLLYILKNINIEEMLIKKSTKTMNITFQDKTSTTQS